MAFTKEIAVLMDVVFKEGGLVIVDVFNTEDMTAIEGLTVTDDDDDDDDGNSGVVCMIFELNSALSGIIGKSFKDDSVLSDDISITGTEDLYFSFPAFDESDLTNFIDIVKCVKSLFDRIFREPVVDVAGCSLVADE